MALAAAQVADALVARLGGTASANRFHPFAEADLPAWRVALGRDSISTSPFGDMEKHEQEVIVTGHLRAVADLDDAANDLIAAGLAAIHGTQAASFTVRTATVDRDFAEDGEAAVSRVNLRLLANFTTATTDPNTLL